MKANSLSPIQLEAKRVIQTAYETARLAKECRYVFSSGLRWCIEATQPSFFISHWRVMPNGDLFAHVAEHDTATYKYEEVV